MADVSEELYWNILFFWSEHSVQYVLVEEEPVSVVAHISNGRSRGSSENVFTAVMNMFAKQFWFLIANVQGWIIIKLTLSKLKFTHNSECTALNDRCVCNKLEWTIWAMSLATFILCNHIFKFKCYKCTGNKIPKDATARLFLSLLRLHICHPAHWFVWSLHQWSSFVLML